MAPARSPKPILQNVKLEVAGEGATLMATDLEVGIRISRAGRESETPGSAVLPIARFGPILRECTDEKLYLESDPQGTLVRGDRSEWKLPAENPEEFPNVTAFKEEKYHELAARLFREMVRRTMFATDNESSRYALGGVLLGNGGRQNHRRRHRRPPAGENGRSGAQRRRSSNRPSKRRSCRPRR